MGKYKVEITGINTNNLKSLKMKDMTELFKEYQNGNLDAKEKLIYGNLKLVLSIINNYNNGKYDMNDLFQVGCVGLIKAVDNFNLDVGVMFSTYAVPLILGEIKRYIRDSNSIKITRSIKDLTYHIMKFKDEYMAIYGIDPPLDEILKKMNITEYEYNEAINSINAPVSIYEPIYNDGGDTIYLLDQISDKDINKDDLISLKYALANLKDKERDIIIKRYILGMTQMELAEKFNVSQAQISRIESSGIKNLRKMIH